VGKKKCVHIQLLYIFQLYRTLIALVNNAAFSWTIRSHVALLGDSQVGRPRVTSARNFSRLHPTPLQQNINKLSVAFGAVLLGRIRYVLPVLWVTSRLHVMGHMTRRVHSYIQAARV